ncbi:hypothetical protein BDR07DRAFT_491609 [Suillus spraguei]|nr:hypothetical protein BDR07DRAFT_491609 [Suillus spraguei]
MVHNYIKYCPLPSDSSTLLSVEPYSVLSSFSKSCTEKVRTPSCNYRAALLTAFIMKTSLNVSPTRPRLRLGAFMGSKSQRTYSPLIDTYPCKIQWYNSARPVDGHKMHCSNQRPEESCQCHPAHLLMPFDQTVVFMTGSILYIIISSRD